MPSPGWQDPHSPCLSLLLRTEQSWGLRITQESGYIGGLSWLSLTMRAGVEMKIIQVQSCLPFGYRGPRLWGPRPVGSLSPLMRLCSVLGSWAFEGRRLMGL